MCLLTVGLDVAAGGGAEEEAVGLLGEATRGGGFGGGRHIWT